MLERYEILGQIAVGDFAVIYRGRDRELLREVAIKQIHKQFLADPRQLERFWREAQLLASLQHPHIITIYDVVRPRGWLVMELMEGSLRDLAQEEPMDVDFVRTVLASCLDALRFLHGQGIIHGDIKPSNILVNRDGRIKLGDFGLARRVTSKDGSLLKGTTKYLAPEVVSEQFGEVGPASDLYSLGITAYELLCGNRFRDLFPGLSAFGRDEQLAWLMWHAAADLQLPPVRRVLQGVPMDVATVIDRLVKKDQSQRFSSAEEALAHLAVGGPGMPPPRVVEPAKASEAPAPSRGRKRVVAAVAVIASAILTLWLLWPQSSPPPAAPPAIWGTIRVVDIGDRRIEVLRDDAPKLLEIRISPGDQFVLNFVPVPARELLEGDRVKIEFIRDEGGKSVRKVTAFRPQIFRGIVEEVQPAKVVLKPSEDKAGDLLAINLSDSTKVLLNQEEVLEPVPDRWGAIQSGDQVVIDAFPDESGWHAREVQVTRLVTFQGVVKSLDQVEGRLVWETGETATPSRAALWASDCVVLINGQSQVFGKAVSVADLRPGDKITLEADTQIRRIEAYRVFELNGTLANVDIGSRTIVLRELLPITRFRIVESTQLTLEDESVSTAELRPGDRVTVQFEDLSSSTPPALRVVAMRPPDPRRRAILIGVNHFDDPTLTQVAAASSDLALLRDRLQRRYRVPPDNIRMLLNPSKQEFEETLKLLPGETEGTEQLIVYVLTNAYLDEEGNPFLAPRDFQILDMSRTGIDLRWFVARLEACGSPTKLLLLDVCRAGKGADLLRQPSSAEIVQSLSPRGRRLPLRTVTAIASCSAGERGLVDEESGSSLFARQVAHAFEGQADANRDGTIEVKELFAFLQRSVPAVAKAMGAKQTPQLFLPDTSPPRLTEAGKSAIRRLASFLSQTKPDLKLVKQEYDNAVSLAKTEPEPHILYGLLMLRSWQRDEAARIFAELRVRHPDLLVARQALVWINLERRYVAEAARALAELAELLVKLNSTDQVSDPLHLEMATWTGQLREFAASLDGVDEILAKVDEQMARCGPAFHEAYERGRNASRAVLKKFDDEIAVADSMSLPQLRMERRQLRHYASFPYEQWVSRILEGLDDE